MKTIRYHIAAGGMLAALASVLFAGSAFAQEAGKARLTDIPAEASSADADQELIIRGSSDIRRRNAQTTQALKALFAGNDAPQASGAAVQQVAHNYVMPASACCPTDDCCPATCAAPAQCCAPDACCAPAACAPQCCAPANCCAPQAGCGCPAGRCDCGPSCACPADGCSCPNACDNCAPGNCACPDHCCPNACDGCAAVGRVHIGDNFSLVGCADTCDGGACGSGHGNGKLGRRHARTCKHGYGNGDCPYCRSGSCLNRNRCADFLCEQAAAHRARNRLASYNLNQYLHCKLGCFIHDGNGGVGSPMFGHYSIVYPADAGYFDSRDGGVYAAQGYGGAVSVPLAPTVRYAWNYGWGIPSSRLTPVSNTPAP